MSQAPHDDQRCPFCGQPTRPIAIHHVDGSITNTNECASSACVHGPSGLLTINYRKNDTGRVTSATKYNDSQKFIHGLYGEPSENEDNVETVARLFIRVVNQQFGTTYDKYVPSPTCARHERGYDCEIQSSKEGYRLQLQVTRALPGYVYRRQRVEHQRIVSQTICGAAEWIMEAIKRKKTRASQDIALIVDGVDAPFLAFLTDAWVSAENLTALERHKWHSIWIVGPTGARKLSGRTLP